MTRELARQITASLVAAGFADETNGGHSDADLARGLPAVDVRQEIPGFTVRIWNCFSEPCMIDVSDSDDGMRLFQSHDPEKICRAAVETVEFFRRIAAIESAA